MDKAGKPVLSIIIVKYHCEDYLQDCLSSIGKDPRWEVIVVDNDKENVGFGAGCNQGAQKAKGKYLFFLNPDTLVLEGAFREMVDFMDKNPDVAVLGPKIYRNEKKEKQLSFCHFPDPLTAIFVFSPLKNFWPGNKLFHSYVYSEDEKDNGVIDVEAVAGAAILARRDVFEKVDGFDQNFFLYFEENDLCRRVKKLGGRIVYFPKAEIVHFGGKSTEQFIPRDYVFRQSRFYFFQKHYGLPFGLLTEGLIRVLETIASDRKRGG